MKKAESRYSQVKNYILDGISQGSWIAGERVPSENELVDLCDVSRMTARRALQELYIEGTLVRIKGKGSFVAEEKQQSSLLQIRSIAAEIKEQGFNHHAELIHCANEIASQNIIRELQLGDQQPCAHSQLLHFQEQLPIQLELRWVNLEIAPEYSNQDFTEMTPSEYLTSIAPVTEAEHKVEAIIGDKKTRNLLEVEESEAILLLERKTWCNGKLVSYAKLYHPGNRYRLGTKFKTT
ncbi:histidine utilization repressor [Aliikangiella coralliicola]|uniref:Histidine utilization repressor n=1 Tax=Aliikangiella coralliicola TaxID=2592383 RepID=A0A545TZZ8_9GAMM|nr:histidine utilization repressor [Aliikangiella coralliicola]TQV82763.1 histidine utilization repressor [Aliikangiella coralliicola]